MVKRELRALAEELRKQGWSVPAIAVEPRVARSTAFQWTKHIPREGTAEAIARRKALSKQMTDARWAEHRVEQAAARSEILSAAQAEVGELSARARWWVEQLGLPPDTRVALSLKRHNPSPHRYNVGDDYRGCLVIRVLRPRRLYWRIEGIMNGLVGKCREQLPPEALS